MWTGELKDVERPVPSTSEDTDEQTVTLDVEVYVDQNKGTNPSAMMEKVGDRRVKTCCLIALTDDECAAFAASINWEQVAYDRYETDAYYAAERAA